MARKNKSQDQQGAPLWMVTYGDMMSLLLTFFILIASFSSIEMAKFQKAMGSLKGALGTLRSFKSQISIDTPIFPKLMNFPSEDVKNVFEEIHQMTGYMEEEKSIELEWMEKGIRIIFSDPVLFELGQSQLRKNSCPVLKEIFSKITSIPCTIMIEGHTDDLPIKTKKYPSNWELSSMRALEVLHFAVDSAKVDPRIISAIGFGEFRPRVPNDSDINRGCNRRVEILVDYAPDIYEGMTTRIIDDFEIQKLVDPGSTEHPESYEESIP